MASSWACASSHGRFHWLGLILLLPVGQERAQNFSKKGLGARWEPWGSFALTGRSAGPWHSHSVCLGCSTLYVPWWYPGTATLHIRDAAMSLGGTVA